MGRLLALYRLFNILSIDVALGAVACSAYLVCMVEVQLPWPALICLGLTVWLIYTADHLVDARKVKAPAATLRHRFHQLHYHALLGASVLIAVTLFLLLFTLQHAVLAGGAALALLVLCYFVGQPQLGRFKELFAAILYTGGVALPALALWWNALSLFHVLVLMVLAITALLNLVLFAWFDVEQDQRDNHPSLARHLGKTGTKYLLYCLFLVQLGLTVGGITMFSDKASFLTILLLMNGGLLFIFMHCRWFATDERYRLAGDAVFLFPILHLLF